MKLIPGTERMARLQERREPSAALARRLRIDAGIPALVTNRVALLLGVLLLLGLSHSANADVKLDATAGFGDTYRPQSWNPITITITGTGANASGELQVIVSTQDSVSTYAKPVQLHAGQLNEQHTLSYFHHLGRGPTTITTQLLIDGRRVAETKVERSFSLTETQPAIAALTSDQAGLSYLAKTDLGIQHYSDAVRNPWNGFGGANPTTGTNTVRMLYPPARTLPDSPSGYTPVDIVMLGDMPLDSLADDQLSALLGWVRDGGTLVVSGSADLNRLRNPSVSGLIPVTPKGVRQVSTLASLGSRYGVTSSVRPTPFVESRLKSDATALCSEGSLPVVAYRRVGSGVVLFTAFDLTSPEMRAWPGMSALWQEMAAVGQGDLKAARILRLHSGWTYGSFRGLADALAGVQSSEAPSFTFIGLFLVLYIVCLVPVNYFILRRLDRKELAWLTSLAIIFLFSTGAYAVGYSIKGGSLFLRYAGVVEGAANEDSFRAYTIASVFSPRQARYDISVGDGSALATESTMDAASFRAPTADLTILRDGRTHVKDAVVSMWDHRTFAFQSHLKLGGMVTGSVLPGNGTYRVRVTNNTRFALSDGVISYRGQFTPVGSLAPGQSAEREVGIGAEGGASRFGPVLAEGLADGRGVSQIKQALAATLSTNELGVEGRDPFVFTGWFPEDVADLKLAGETPRQEGLNLLVVHLTPPNASSPAQRIRPVRPVPSQPFGFRPAPAFPTRVPTDMDSGNQAYFAGNYASAEVWFRRVVTTDPRDSQAWNMLAYALAGQKKMDAALQAAQKSLSLSPGSGMIMDTVAEMHQKRGEYAKADQYYQRALKAGTTGAETHEKYGETLLALGRRQEAITQFKAAVRDNSGWGQKARRHLQKLGVQEPLPNGGARLLRNAPRSSVPTAAFAPPPIPNTPSGSRRIVTAAPGGGFYVTRQKWTRRHNGASTSNAMSYVPAGQPIPP